MMPFRFFGAACGLFFLFSLASCQQGTPATASIVNETADSMPSKADILDFATDFMTQFEAAAHPYFEAVDAVWDTIELEEGEEMTYLPDFDEERSRKWIRDGIEGMTVLSDTFKAKMEEDTRKGLETGETWNFGCSLVGNTAGVGIEHLEFPNELHDSIHFDETGNKATFKMYIIGDHYNYPVDASVQLECSKKGDGWVLEGATLRMH